MSFEALIQTAHLKRGTTTLPLAMPKPMASIEEIRAFNQAQYPELATCGVDTQTTENGPLIEFKAAVGSRG